MSSPKTPTIKLPLRLTTNFPQVLILQGGKVFCNCLLIDYRALRVNLEANRFTGPGNTELAPTSPLYKAPGTLNALPFTTSSKPTRATSSDVHHKNSGNCV
jgi:hypothetical protein